MAALYPPGQTGFHDLSERPTNIDQSAPHGAGWSQIRRLKTPRTAFVAVSVVGLGLAAGAASLVADGTPDAAMQIGAGIFALLAGVAGMGLARDYPHSALGLCNSVTLLRMSLAAALVAALVTGGGEAWPLFTVAALAFALDGVDGYLARREGLTSAFGARFDMEVDSILALTLAALAFQSGAAGAYVLLLGLPRYAFGAAALIWPWMTAQLPERFSRKVVCVIQIAVLLAMLFPPAGSPFTDILAGVAAMALIWSFWRDVDWLRRTARTS
ncbi:CDP-alcohol phosphatidyltransferase [Rhodobacterales bacterium HKCCE4037]|nr:CDP-alcohol phosphatidyltransferase [Rhodobacterales bacterium HKCCE4037]